MDTKEAKPTYEDAIRAMVFTVGSELGGMSSDYYSSKEYEDRYIIIRTYSSYGREVLVKAPANFDGMPDGEPTSVFQAKARFRYEAIAGYDIVRFRKGRWILHVEQLYQQAQAAIDERQSAANHEEAVAFEPIDDSATFNNPPGYRPVVKAEPTLEERLLDVLREFVQANSNGS